MVLHWFLIRQNWKTEYLRPRKSYAEENYENKANYVENVIWIQRSWTWMTEDLYKERLKIP